MGIVDYLQSCLTGERKGFFTKFAPYSQHWTISTDVTWNAQNPLDIAVQIARFYEDVKQALPQIIVRTNGHTGAQQNLGSFSFGERVSGTNTQRVGIVDAFVVPVALAIAAGDPDGAECLSHFLETAFGPLSRFLHNYQLFPSEPSKRNWCVFLPLTWSVDSLTDVPIGDDRKNRLWTIIYNLETRVEVANWSEYETPINAYELKAASTQIAIPSTVHVGSTTPLIVAGYRPGGASWRINDYRVAIITGNGALYAKRPGTVLVSLISDLHDNQTFVSKQVTVVP